jgi:hypothetical protein
MTRVPVGIRNAGFNLLELPAWRVYGKLNLNTWMGFAQSSQWPLIQRAGATVAEWGIRAAIPAAGAGAAYGGYKLGEALTPDGSR